MELTELRFKDSKPEQTIEKIKKCLAEVGITLKERLVDPGIGNCYSVHVYAEGGYPMFTNGKLYYSHTYGEGDVLHLAGLEITVLHTPGHTPGSVCLICENMMFSGDTLFEGACGRTDIGGSWPQIQASLARLAGLDTDYIVYPGHGGSTTLAMEKRYNPYMR